MSAKQQSGCPRMISGVVRLELNIDYGKNIRSIDYGNSNNYYWGVNA